MTSDEKTKLFINTLKRKLEFEKKKTMDSGDVFGHRAIELTLKIFHGILGCWNQSPMPHDYNDLISFFELNELCDAMRSEWLSGKNKKLILNHVYSLHGVPNKEIITSVEWIPNQDCLSHHGLVMSNVTKYFGDLACIMINTDILEKHSHLQSTLDEFVSHNADNTKEYFSASLSKLINTLIERDRIQKSSNTPYPHDLKRNKI